MTFKKVLLEIRSSFINGVGVFAIQDIEKESFIAEGIHEDDYLALVTWREYYDLDSLIQKKIMDFCVGTPNGFIPPEDNDFNKLSIEWYFNHSCNGNIGFNDCGDFIALRRILNNEELTYDYGLAESNPLFKMQCKCGSNNCRHIISGNDWNNYEFRHNNINFMLPRLRKILSAM